MNVIRHGGRIRTAALVCIVAATIASACGSSASKPNASAISASAPPTTAPVTSGPTPTESTPTTPVTQTTAVTDTTVVAREEPLPEDLQQYLTEHKVHVSTDLCTTTDNVKVPVLSIENQILVDAVDADTATSVAKEVLGKDADSVTPYTDGDNRKAAGVFLATSTFETNPDLVSRLNTVNASHAPGGPVSSLNYLYSPLQVWRFHPFGLPTDTSQPTDGGAGGNARLVDVFDSGFPTSPITAIDPASSTDIEAAGVLVSYPVLAPAGTPTTSSTSTVPGFVPVGAAVGHGPFVTFLIKRFAQQAAVHEWGIRETLGPDGPFVSVVDVQAAMSTAFGEQRSTDGSTTFTGVRPDVINLSLGGAGCAGAEPAVLSRFLDRVTDKKSWQSLGTPAAVPVIAAAAGNNSTDALEYPAALPQVIAVGSMTGGAQDCFSNYGGWVDVWAPGADQISQYPNNTGWAKWSGTSFATARFSALLVSTAAPGQTVADRWAALQQSPPTDLSVTPVTSPPQPC